MSIEINDSKTKHGTPYYLSTSDRYGVRRRVRVPPRDDRSGDEESGPPAHAPEPEPLNILHGRIPLVPVPLRGSPRPVGGVGVAGLEARDGAVRGPRPRRPRRRRRRRRRRGRGRRRWIWRIRRRLSVRIVGIRGGRRRRGTGRREADEGGRAGAAAETGALPPPPPGNPAGPGLFFLFRRVEEGRSTPLIPVAPRTPRRLRQRPARGSGGRRRRPPPSRWPWPRRLPSYRP